MLWLGERWGEDPKDFKWSEMEEYDGYDWDGTVDPLFKIWESVAMGVWTGVEAAIGVGKTYSAVRVIYWFLDVFENSTVRFIAPTAGHLKTTLWVEMKEAFNKFQRLQPQAKLFDSMRIACDEGDLENSKHQAIGLGARVRAGEKTNIKLQGGHGKHMLYVIDEAAGIAHSILESIIQTCISENNIILMLGNPDNETDALHEFCERFDVNHIRISAFDHPNIILNEERYPGAATIKSIKSKAGKNNENIESSLFLSRVQGISPKEGEFSLMKSGALDKAYDLGRLDDDEFPWDDDSYNAVGVDVARSTAGDKAAVVFGKKNRLELMKDFQCPNASHLAYNLIFNSEECEDRGYNVYHLPTVGDYDIYDEQIGVDAGGVGFSTVETLEEEGYMCRSMIGGPDRDAIPVDENKKPVIDFVSFRSQGIWTFFKELNRGEFGIVYQTAEIKREFKKECLAHRKAPGIGKIKIEDKGKTKDRLGGKSPNLFDAAWMWNWVRKDRDVLRGKGGIDF